MKVNMVHEDYIWRMKVKSGAWSLYRVIFNCEANSTSLKLTSSSSSPSPSQLALIGTYSENGHI
jgi:hypothetical protein